MKRKAAVSIFIVFIGLYLACYTMFISVSTMNVFNTEKVEVEKTMDGEYSDRETELLKFIQNRMMGQAGQIYTNSRPSTRLEGTLSESVGLFMNYCVYRGKRDLFDKEMGYLQSKLLTEDNYIKWRDSKEKATCNAAIDDFRIVRALLDAYEKWGDKTYMNLAGFIQDRIFEKQVEDDSIYEFYDWKSNKCKKTIPLCYLDLYAMNFASDFNKGWLRVSDRGSSIISNGKMGSKSPFYYKYYDYKSNKYLPDEEYKKNNGICLTYTLYTVLHLAEMNEDTSQFTEWLTKEMDNGKLYAWYDPKSLKPSNEMESTAVYALAAVYSKKVGEDDLYHKLIGRMTTFRVTDVSSPNYGGFGNEQTGDFYSFDNLTALWALAME